MSQGSAKGAIIDPAMGGDLSGTASNAQIVADAVGVTEIAAGAVTYAKIQDVSAASRILGRGSLSGSGDVEEITLGAGLSMTGTALSASGSDPVMGGDLSGTASNAQIVAGVVGTTELADTNVTNAKLANMADATVKGRALAAGAGVPTDLTAAQVRTLIDLAAQISGSSVGGAVTGTVSNIQIGALAVGTAELAADAVTFPKMVNVATDSLIGRDAAGTGDPETILLNATLSMDGAANLQRSALTGHVTAAAGSNATTIAAGVVTDAMVVAANKDGLAATASMRTLGNGATQAAAGNDARLSDTRTPTDGTVTTVKIVDANVTYAKLQDVSAASKLLGRGSAGGSGDVEEITLGTGLTMTGTTLAASGGGGDPVMGGDLSGTASNAQIVALAVGTAELDADAVTYAKLQNVSAASRLLGRGSAGGSGDAEELTVGAGLSITGTALASTALAAETSWIPLMPLMH